MIGKFSDVLELTLFDASEEAKRSPSSIQLAAAILMFEVVKADGRVDRMEMAEMIELLQKNFTLSGEDVGTLLEMAGDMANEASRLEPFTLKIRQNWNAEERLQLLKDFWIIAIADRDIDDREIELIQSIADKLDLAEDDIALARSNAEQRLELGLT